MEIAAWIAGFIKGCWTICVFFLILLVFITAGLWGPLLASILNANFDLTPGQVECYEAMFGFCIIYVLLKSRYGMD